MHEYMYGTVHGYREGPRGRGGPGPAAGSARHGAGATLESRSINLRVSYTGSRRRASDRRQRGVRDGRCGLQQLQHGGRGHRDVRVGGCRSGQGGQIFAAKGQCQGRKRGGGRRVRNEKKKPMAEDKGKEKVRLGEKERWRGGEVGVCGRRKRGGGGEETVRRLNISLRTRTCDGRW